MGYLDNPIAIGNLIRTRGIGRQTGSAHAILRASHIADAVGSVAWAVHVEDGGGATNHHARSIGFSARWIAVEAKHPKGIGGVSRALRMGHGKAKNVGPRDAARISSGIAFLPLAPIARALPVGRYRLVGRTKTGGKNIRVAGEHGRRHQKGTHYENPTPSHPMTLRKCRKNSTRFRDPTR